MSLFDRIRAGDVRAAQTLLKGTVENEDLRASLFCAARMGYRALVEALVKKGVDVKVRDSNGDTALISVIRWLRGCCAR